LTNRSLIGYTDADWGGCLTTGRSTTGMLFLFNGGPIAWCSRRQKNVTTSTAESEYVAASETAKESSWITNILPDLLPEWKGPIPLHCDNQAAIGSAEHPNQGKKMKHVRLKYHHIRELIEEKEITIEYVRSEEQLADIFTKALPGPRFNSLREAMGVVEVPSLS